MIDEIAERKIEALAKAIDWLMARAHLNLGITYRQPDKELPDPMPIMSRQAMVIEMGDWEIFKTAVKEAFDVEASNVSGH